MKIGLVKLVPFLLVLTIVFLLSACSKNQSPVTPQDNSNSLPNWSSGENQDSNRSIIGVYRVTMDPEAGTVDISPDKRFSNYHLNVSSYFPNALSLTAYGYYPKPWFDINLSHPYQGSGVQVYDPRIIAVVPANPGVSFNYPGLDVNGNNTVVSEPDGYTTLFDFVSDIIPGNANPFKAYFKNEPNRCWSDMVETSETQRWFINLSGFSGPFYFDLVVDVSTNYPDASQPVIDNAPEPVQIKAEIGAGLTPAGGNASVTVTLLDWQGLTGIEGVAIECPSLFNGFSFLSYSGPGLNPDEYVYTGTISNSRLAPAGEYRMMVATRDHDSGIRMFQEFKVRVQSDITFNLTDITPQGLNFIPNSIYMSGNFAYVTGSTSGFKIYDVSDPSLPQLAKWLPVTTDALSVYVSNGYAFIARGMSGGIDIFDIDPPASASLVRTINTPPNSENVFVSDGLIYVTNGYAGLVIIDPFASTPIIKTIPPVWYSRSVYVQNGYAYVTDESAGLQIIDVDPPESASIVNTVDVGEYYVGDVEVSGSYAYVTGAYSGLHIIDIDPPTSANLINTVYTEGSPVAVDIINGYAYLADGWGGIDIIHVNPPESAFIVSTLPTMDYTISITCNGENAFVVDNYAGISSYDVNPPENPVLLKSFGKIIDSEGIQAEGNYAFLGDSLTGLHILDISNPESIFEVNAVTGQSGKVAISNGYAYVTDFTDGSYGLSIYDIDPIESAHFVQWVHTWGWPTDIWVANGYAYFSVGYEGLEIIDINPPETASIVGHVASGGYVRSVYAENGIAYLASDFAGLEIVDVDPPETASIINTVALPSLAFAVQVYKGNAFVTDWDGGLQIVDVTSPETASVIKTVYTPYGWDIDIADGYAYIAAGEVGLQVVDIDPPMDAMVVASIGPLSLANSVSVQGNYAYVANFTGLQIISLR